VSTNRQMWFAVAVAGGLGTVLLSLAAGLRFNVSPSLPIGLYQVTSKAAGIVEFCPIGFVSVESRSRGYREGPGVCPDGGKPFAKPLVARAGDTVVTSPAGIAVNGRLLPNTAPRRTDHDGRPLRPWPFGSYQVEPGKVWVVSSYNNRSYDSRYFGPIPVGAIRSYLRPVLTWHIRKESE
jgi:conjugative transfer signal peptidase TraF